MPGAADGGPLVWPVPVSFTVDVGVLPPQLEAFSGADGERLDQGHPLARLLLTGEPGCWSGTLRSGGQQWYLEAVVSGGSVAVTAAPPLTEGGWVADLVDTLHEGVFVLNADGVVVWANRSAASLLGFSAPEQTLGRGPADPVWQVTSPDGRLLPPEEYAGVKALRSGEAVGPELIRVGVVGSDAYVWLSTSARPCLLADGSVGVVSSFVDVSELVAAQDVSRQRELLLSKVVDGLLEAVAVCREVLGRSGDVVDLELDWTSPSAAQVLRVDADRDAPVLLSHLVPRRLLPGLLELVTDAKRLGVAEQRFDLSGVHAAEGLPLYGTIRVSVSHGYVIVALVDETVRAQAAFEAAGESAQFREVLESLHESVVLVDRQSSVKFASGALAFLVDAELVAFDGSALDPVRSPVFRALAGDTVDAELVAFRDRGALRPVLVSARPVPSGAAVSFRDLSPVFAASGSLASVRTQLQLALEHVPFPVVFFARDESGVFRPQVANAPATQLRELVESDSLARSLWAEAFRQDLQSSDARLPVSRTLQVCGQTWRCTVAVTGEHAVAVAVDLTEVSQQTEQLRWLSTHHPDSRLPNMAGLAAAVEARAARGGSFAVAWVVLNELDDVREAFGFAVANQVLACVCARLVEVLPPGVLLAQPESSVVAVLVESTLSLEQVDALGRALVERLSSPVTVQSVTLLVTGAVGFAVGPLHGVDAQVLLQRAKVAASQAVRGGVPYARWVPSVAARQLERTGLLADVPAAFERGEFQVLFQPEVELVSGRVVSAQLRLRWQHPTRGVLPAGEFLPKLAQSSWVRPLFTESLAEALRRAGSLRELFPAFRLVHAVPSSSMPWLFVPDLADLLVRCAASPDWLELEFSEKDLCMPSGEAEPVSVSSVVRQLAAMGVSVSLGSFGAGFASLVNVRRWPLSSVRLDRVFTRGLARDRSLQVAVGALIDVAHQAQVSVTATGVESVGDLEVLRSLGCDRVQGYLVHRPVAFDALVDLAGSSFSADARWVRSQEGSGGRRG